MPQLQTPHKDNGMSVDKYINVQSGLFNIVMITTHPGEPPLAHLRASHFHQATVALAAPASPALIKTQKHTVAYLHKYYILKLKVFIKSTA